MSCAQTDPLDELAISNLVIRERWYRDTSQWERLRSCYHPDDSKTRITISWINDTADGFVKGSKEMASKGTNAIHTISPADIKISGRKAIIQAPASIMIRFEAEGHEYELVSYCRLLYRVEKVNASEWRIQELGVIYVRDMIVPVVPQVSSFPQDAFGGRESYKHMTWVLSRRGFCISQALAGVDLPDTVDQIVQEQDNWLLR